MMICRRLSDQIKVQPLSPMEILSFFCGMYFYYYAQFFVIFLMIAVLFITSNFKLIYPFLFAWFCSGIHDLLFFHSAESELINQSTVLASGYVDSIPNIKNQSLQFQFHVLKINQKRLNLRLWVSCFEHCPQFKVGEYWQLKIHLSRPHSFENPGGFSFLKWLAVKHIHWVAYVQTASPQIQIKAKQKINLSSIREAIARKMEEEYKDHSEIGISQALALGLTRHIQQSQWDLFRRTGTTHLMVISGSHIALVAGMVFTLIKLIWSRSGSLALYLPAQKIAAILALIFATFYSLLAGFEVPSQRALIACFLALYSYLSRFYFSVWQRWRIGVFLILCLEPHNIYISGFYLSFFAVAILILINQCVKTKGIKKALILQFACCVGMLPVSLFWFSYASINGFIANIFAIPLIGIFIVPLSLINIFLLYIHPIYFLQKIESKLIDILMVFLVYIDQFNFLNINFSFTKTTTLIALIFFIMILSFIPLFALVLPSFFMVLGLFFPESQSIRSGQYRVDVLDVGQGLAVAVHTAKHHLLFDTGTKYYRGADAGALVIVPYLKQYSLNHLDALVISHADIDHRGGFESIKKEYPITKLIVDDPNFYHQGQSCQGYADWIWDGVSFHFFKAALHNKKKNNASCVLQIKGEFGSILLTGDIEAKAETYLVNTYKEALRSMVMMVPHHGSKTSSTRKFIQEVAPKYAVISFGMDNRFHFPHLQILSNYQAESVKILDTAHCGLIRLDFKNPRFIPWCYKKMN